MIIRNSGKIYEPKLSREEKEKNHEDRGSRTEKESKSSITDLIELKKLINNLKEANFLISKAPRL